MEKEDFRTIEDPIQSSCRRKAINLIGQVVKKGEIAILFGVTKITVSNWCKQYKATGSFKLKKKGVKSEDKKLISNAKEKAKRLLIITIIVCIY
jgi:transposase